MGKGNIIGKTNDPTISTASGVWSLREQFLAQRTATWPNGIVGSGLNLYLDAGYISSYPGSGNFWYDISGNSFTASLSGTDYTTDAGGGIVFGSGDTGSLPAAPFTFTGGGFTVSIWLKHTGVVSTARTQRYFTLSTSSGASEGPVVRHNASSAASLHGYLYDTNSTFQSIDISNQIFTNTYYNVVYSYNGSTFKLYNNKNTVGTLNASISLRPAFQGLLGNATEYFEGNMYIVQYYNRSLTDAEVATNFDVLKGRFGLP